MYTGNSFANASGTDMKSILLPLFAGTLFAQPAGPDPLLRWMDGIAQRQLQLRETAIAGIHSVADADRRKQWVRQTFLSILGGLPDYSGPLNPRITGQIEAAKYTIEKIIFESLPGFYVTANLYRPNQPGRYPGILLQAGHTQEGKPEGQRAINYLTHQYLGGMIGGSERNALLCPSVLRPPDV
jgi:hypothetical protein